MKSLTREWVDKADGDFATAQRELRARKTPNYDAACFHAQQCAEKYLKAFLQEHDVEFGKTHNLFMLLDKVITVVPILDTLRQVLQVLTVFAVDYRYPGETADKAMAAEAVKLCMEVRGRFRELLGE
ncbi:MAG: HEPN domain-containing protein [Deltaproteobacteria bacterium]|jgi:HEPN domain-containing protein|nr:HEPN domain-containing protein [Deltaproteobacteria bacterium]